MGVDVNNAWPLTCKASCLNKTESRPLISGFDFVGGTKSVRGFPTDMTSRIRYKHGFVVAIPINSPVKANYDESSFADDIRQYVNNSKCDAENSSMLSALTDLIMRNRSLMMIY